ncbi:ribosomal protein S18-alanine N-acetyltransferase [Devosia sp. ZB163]|uniref:ribosomal protein S18-alanine N-acetyltransferase n=1 Tax=Devosia sp. ZB163 TaxID=3025938 RepID=UPI00235E3619|nr:ribosomal protein S18-alanine N-acetyltransferase [Devosia sp. ZB163]MDC9822458.1 ribosomal protein S18-alanine N-acetyltransferase [Devosia sp. ZB163]
MKLWLAPAGLHIEPARTQDADAITKLHAQGFYRGWSREEFAAYILDERTPIYVACDARRRVAGFAMIRHLGEDVELITIAVDKKWRKKGVGLALMRALFDDLLMSPAKRLILEVATDNAAAMRLYEKLGFKKVGERKGYYPRPDGTPATAIVMARDLG